jgi:tRNA(Ile)-lysidine synthase
VGSARINQQVLDFLSSVLSSIPQSTVKLCLAFSGGLDSCVLLSALLNTQKKLNFELSVMHVHHGLSPNADAWADFCTETCQAAKVPIQVERVKVDQEIGLGVEAAARQARYQALLESEADFIVLAHHQDDQSETFLLQLLRGAGVKGLSAMAAFDKKRRLLRPLLDVSRAEIEAYASDAKLKWVEDESNQDVHYDRNFIRHEVTPLLTQRFPSFQIALARSASHMAETSGLLDDLAGLDAETCIQESRLNLLEIVKLSEARAKNLVRWWLASLGFSLPSKERLDEILKQLLHAKSDATIKLVIDADKANLRRYQGFAFIERVTELGTVAMIWQGEAELQLPDGSKLLFERKQGEGLAIDRLGSHKLRIANRKGGERFKPDLHRPTRTLKHLLQEANIPPWERNRLPLIYFDDALAVVPKIGVNCLMQANEKEVGLVISWTIPE